jgi:hypothetical protein
MTTGAKLSVVAAMMLLALGSAAGAQEQIANQGFVTVESILTRSCGDCHGEVAGYGELSRSGWVVPGAPDRSPLYRVIADDSMPPGEPLPVTEKNLLRSWIAAGASDSEAPIAATMPGEPEGQAGSAAGEAPAGEAAGPRAAGPHRFLGFPSKLRFHQVSGFASGSLLLASGVVGAVQFGTFIAEGHAYRDANGIEEDQISSECSAYISKLWRNPMHTALRWTHVGLLVSGETLYVANAVTGLSMLTPDRPGLTPQDLHRYAFYTHGALMVAEVVMGFLTSSVLANGTHEQIAAFGIAHSVIGLAIPVTVIASGILIDRSLK